MPADSHLPLGRSLRRWWREQAQTRGVPAAARGILSELWQFALESTPDRRRSRYGDMDFDWEHRVNTTAGTVGWRERLLGRLHSPYMPTDPASFRQMMAALPIDFREFMFIDLGSGKGRALLMACEFPFHKIAGVEIIPELHRAAEENIAGFRSRNPASQSVPIDALLMDACNFPFPASPLVIYLFNPLPETGLRCVLGNLARSWSDSPRPIWVVYHNPLLENVLADCPHLVKHAACDGYSLFYFA